MKIAAFGDIHSNHLALEACLARAEAVGVDGMVFLGDYVTDCACPQKTLELLRQAAERYPAWFVRGNREEYLIRHDDNPGDGWAYNSRTGSLLYTYEQLTKADVDAFRALPIARVVEPEGAPAFEICHGSPWEARCLLLPDTPYVDRAVRSMRTKLLMCAHSHKAFVLEKNGRTIVNGGAVGMPTDGRTGANFAIIDWNGDEWKARLMHVDYDVEAVIREFHESGFAERANVWARAISDMLRTGRDCALMCLALVQRYADEGAGEEEALWERAAKELGI